MILIKSIIIIKLYNKEGGQWSFHCARKIKYMKSQNLTLKDFFLKYGEMLLKKPKYINNH